MANLLFGRKKTPFVAQREVVAGITTFFAMVYIAFLNPSILYANGAGVPFRGAFVATVLLCSVMTMLMGWYARLPVAVAPGMGVNGFFVVTLLGQKHISWPVALGLVFWSGLLFLLVSLTPLRKTIMEAIPAPIKVAVTVGLGLFLALVGFQQGQIIAPAGDASALSTWLPLSKMSICVWVGLLLTMGLLHRKSIWAFLIGMVTTVLLGAVLGLVKMPSVWVAWPDFRGAFFKLDVWGALKLSFVPTLLALFFTDLMDSFSSLIAIKQTAPFLDTPTQPFRLKQGLVVSGWSTLVAGLLGTSSGTVYLESLAGIESGGRTGWTAMVTGLCFLPLLFFSPMAEFFPVFVAAPLLIAVGFLMVRSIQDMRISSMLDGVPAFLTAVLIPYTGSVTQGILWGGVSFGLFYILGGKAKELSVKNYVFSGCCGVLLLIEHNVFSSVLRGCSP